MSMTRNSTTRTRPDYWTGGRRRAYGTTRAPLAGMLLALLPAAGFAAGATLIPPDGNSHIVVQDALVEADGTRLLYLTYPDIRDAVSDRECPVNLYAVSLAPGLPEPQQTVVARGVCAILGTQASLLPDGSALVLVAGRLERWRDGRRVASFAFAEGAATANRGIDGSSGGQQFGLAPGGGAVAAVPFSGDGRQRSADSGVDVLGFGADGTLRWQTRLQAEGERIAVHQAWAGADGSALLQAEASAADNSSTAVERRLYPVGPAGELRPPVVITADKAMDMAALSQLTPADMERMHELIQGSYNEGIRRIGVSARPGGGFDVLLDRYSGAPEREGQFLLRIGADGRAAPERALGDRIEGHGLERWADFHVEDGQLVLLGEVTATQPGIQARREAYPQAAVTWIDLDGSSQVTRLIPLDGRYLAAAMNAGDADLQHLENRPGGEPVRLARLAGAPLAVSISYLQGRPALRFDAANPDLPAWDEVYQQRQAEREREASRQERRAQRKARQEELDAVMAAAAGMTPEAFAALGNRERKAAMVQGDMAAVMALAQQQAAAAMQQMAEQSGGPGGTTDPQMAAAMAQAMAQLQAAGIDPSAMAGMPAAAGPAAGASAATTDPARTLALDAGRRGFVEYEHPNGAPVTLLIVENDGGRELLRRTYDDGSIYEHVDFGRFGLPLEGIRVRYLDADGTMLRELTPVVVP